MIEWWKVKRELNDATQRIRSLLGNLYEPFIQRQYDRKKIMYLKFREGKITSNGKFALLLLFQPNGINASTFKTCKHLIAKGYAPLIVSNAPITSSDLVAISEVSWKVIIRPNYGHDFGGYRDGILWMLENQINVDRLIILNDSIWFPAWPNETLIDRMEALQSDLIGPVYQPSRRSGVFKMLRPGYLESFFYLVNAQCFKSDHFKKFWIDYRLSSLRINAVRRGEKRLSVVLEKSGHSVDYIFKIDDVEKILSLQSNEFIEKSLHHGAYRDSSYISERDKLLSDDFSKEIWRASAIDHIVTVMRRRSIYASFPYISCHLLQVPFVKKSRQYFAGKKYGTVHIASRTKILAAVECGDLPMPYQEVLQEMRAIEPASE